MNNGKNIISVSRRTDIPAFYGKWFMNRVREGYAGYINPFGYSTHRVSLKKEDVTCFVFWSKNFIPFMGELELLHELGYRFYFNYTINGLPELFEKKVTEWQKTAENLIQLAEKFGAEKINWRYDPVILSGITPVEYHLETFSRLCKTLAPFCGRCIISFVTGYPKVQKNFMQVKNKTGVVIKYPESEEKQRVAFELAKIAESHKLKIYSCCDSKLINERIGKARCVDGELIKQLFPETASLSFKHVKLRKDCGCTASKDIGGYNTCGHGCVYCYANTNPEIGWRKSQNIDNDSPILGVIQEKAELLLSGINKNGVRNIIL